MCSLERPTTDTVSGEWNMPPSWDWHGMTGWLTWWWCSEAFAPGIACGRPALRRRRGGVGVRGCAGQWGSSTAGTPVDSKTKIEDHLLLSFIPSAEEKTLKMKHVAGSTETRTSREHLYNHPSLSPILMTWRFRFYPHLLVHDSSTILMVQRTESHKNSSPIDTH